MWTVRAKFRFKVPSRYVKSLPFYFTRIPLIVALFLTLLPCLSCNANATCGAVFRICVLLIFRNAGKNHSVWQARKKRCIYSYMYASHCGTCKNRRLFLYLRPKRNVLPVFLVCCCFCWHHAAAAR